MQSRAVELHGRGGRVLGIQGVGWEAVEFGR